MSTTFAIKNGVGSLTVKGKTYAKDTYVPIPYIQNDYNVSRENCGGATVGAPSPVHIKAALWVSFQS